MTCLEIFRRRKLALVFRENPSSLNELIGYAKFTVFHEILKFILYTKGNQCNFCETSVIWSYLRLEVSKLAAAFCTPCSLVISQSESP